MAWVIALLVAILAYVLMGAAKPRAVAPAAPAASVKPAARGRKGRG